MTVYSNVVICLYGCIVHAPPTWRRVCVVSTFVVMLISWGVGGYDVGAGAGTDVHCRGRNLARLVLRHAPPVWVAPTPDDELCRRGGTCPRRTEFLAEYGDLRG